MSSARVQRVADRIQVELAEILQRRLRDPRHGFLTVTGVEVSRDLRVAKVFVSTLESAALEATLATLDHAKGFIRHELGQRLTMRHTPEIIFRPDRSAEAGLRVARLLNEIKDGKTADEDDGA
jgi:ribosome-binding factor A